MRRRRSDGDSNCSAEPRTSPKGDFLFFFPLADLLSLLFFSSFPLWLQGQRVRMIHREGEKKGSEDTDDRTAELQISDSSGEMMVRQTA